MFINFSILSEHLDRYLIGLGGTLAASLISLVASFILGAIIAVFRITPVKPLQWLGTIYVEFIRNIPLMLIAFFTLVGLPLVIGTVLIPFVAGLTALTVYTSAFIAEVIRAGIQAIPKGQMEAARSSGLTYTQAMWHIILPQAVKLVIPPLGNQFLNLVKTHPSSLFCPLQTSCIKLT
ncbi:glutamine ABC transporter permease [Paenibacillus alvei A6-6i-x]|nr:glutamine ABC transporter permease [Paenibacillus alvei A6-6i-x]